MKCRFCSSTKTKVVCTERHGNETWRYNKCLHCNKNFKTIEVYALPKKGAPPGVPAHPNSIKRGESNGSSVLTEDNIRRIRELSRQHVTYNQIAKTFGIHKDTVFRIVNLKAWTHV